MSKCWNLFYLIVQLLSQVLHNLSPDLPEGDPPHSCLMHSGIGRPSNPAAPNRFSGRRKKKCMDGCFSTVHEKKKRCLSLPQVGGRRWVELFLHSEEKNLLIIIPKTRKTDWLTFLWVLIFFFFFDSYWSLCLNPVLFMFRYKCRRHCRRCCVVDWDGTGTTTDLWNLTLGLKRRGASVTKKKWFFS